MSGKMVRGYRYLILIVLLCGLAGGALGEAIGQNFKNLAFLKHYTAIGMNNPVTLNLKLISLTFGINFNINILSIFGMIFGYFIYKKM
ncbi:protein of unknown function [Caloramator quimbayensis]|uniref:DUF4321 domain-containing protein n=1 Tax=Caloramator quimbayensis TaxID=1147123 RepID=A0A1T4XYN1_9CLOT|nr:DUF4321 domain-containing protein [Caloramator quimbayensis]SKA94503.1 protein of unknown function [Caloramator quimbayensis]